MKVFQEVSVDFVKWPFSYLHCVHGQIQVRIYFAFVMKAGSRTGLGILNIHAMSHDVP